MACHLGQGERAGVAESLLAAAQPVFVADVADDEAVEGAAFAAGQAAVVEDAGDLGVGVVVGELSSMELNRFTVGCGRPWLAEVETLW